MIGNVVSAPYSFARALFFEDTKKRGEDVRVRVIGKAILTGVSVFVFFGAFISSISVVATIALSAFTAHIAICWFSHKLTRKVLDRGNCSWLAMDRAFKEVTETVKKYFPPFLAINLSIGCVVGFFVRRAGGSGVYQPALQVLVRSFHEGPLSFLKIFLRINLVAPLIEEIIFRGALQEWICHIQAICFSKVNGDFCKIFRIATQAFFFAACHYHPLLGQANIPLFVGTFFFAFIFGMHKEEKKTLWESMTLHAIIDITVCSRILLFGV